MRWFVFACLAAVPTSLFAQAPQAPLEFNRDVRPILSNNCFVCHGPDNNLRKGDLRLDLEKEAHASSVFTPGKPEESTFYERITSKDPNEVMPPKKSNKSLTKAEIEILRRWIAEGAKYQSHWSLIAPRDEKLPAVKNAKWAESPIDRFVLARLEKEKVQPAAPADPRTLIRRLSFDLTGLPPSPAEVDAFVKDPTTYPEVIDRYLNSPHFGERMAIYWLDLVRYADSAGYHSDNPRDVYLYRDWVVDAFNQDMPFDRFTREQLAGDLLPKATNETRIASGYNRLLQTTEEGGAQAKEYQAKYYADRVRNFSTVWMGLTLGCAECHDHKFDPFTTKEFYQLASFFSDIQEKAVGRQAQTPIMKSDLEAKVKAIDSQLEPLQARVAGMLPRLALAQESWEEWLRDDGIPVLPKEIVAVLSLEPAQRSAKQKDALSLYYRSTDPELAVINKSLAELQKTKDALVKNVPTTLITMAGPAKMLKVLPRGNWLDDSGEVVQPATPAALPTLKFQGKRATRLELANWVVADDNPLTARVFVNRIWMLLLGQGIVKTLDDLGSQGTWPTHPELLDWLARDFQKHGWEVKRLIRQIVLSNTYRQSSQASPEMLKRDPYNQLLARQGRWRLDAEMVRDNALAIGGLLNLKVGGPSAKPYQPAGYWAYLNFPKREWQKDVGDTIYRRGLYTHWQRSFLHPSLLAFDAPTREECSVDRTRSNTPQQALVLLNDPTYVEAARGFAQRILKQGGATNAERITFAMREALQRAPRPEELKILESLVDQHRLHFEAHPKEAASLLSIGDLPRDPALAAAEWAAWTSVARAIINLHETITRN